MQVMSLPTDFSVHSTIIFAHNHRRRSRGYGGTSPPGMLGGGVDRPLLRILNFAFFENFVLLTLSLKYIHPFPKT